MQINSSNAPAEDAGAYISNQLRKNSRRTLLLLSGGSAFDVLQHIQITSLSEQTAIMMTDERFTVDPKGSNYLELAETAFFQEAIAAGASVITDEVGTENSTHEDIAHAVNVTLEHFFRVFKDVYVLALLGVGEDGHTASIFPMEKEKFEKAYYSDKLYIPVISKMNKYPERMTITPYFIKKYVTDVVLFATGEGKCSGALKDLVSGNKNVSEVPALIASNHPNSQLFTDCDSLE